MPTMPGSNAMPAAPANIQPVKVVSAIEAVRVPATGRTSNTGRFGSSAWIAASASLPTPTGSRRVSMTRAMARRQQL